MRNSKSTGTLISIQGTSILKLILTFVLFLFLVFSISGLLTSLKPQYRLTSSSVNHAANNLTGDLFYKVLGWENHYFLAALPNENSSPKLTNLLLKLSTNINLNDPRSLLGRELPGFSLFDSKIIVADKGVNYTNLPVESAPPTEVMKAESEAALQNLEDVESAGQDTNPTPPALTTGERKVVFVYFTHNRESYLPYLKGETDPNRAYHSKVNVTKIGDRLKDSLEANGVGTEVSKTDVMGNLNKKKMVFGQAYQESRPVVQTAMSQNRELQYFIDIHRDSHRKDITTTNINGKSYANLAFIIGAEHANYEQNLKLAKELHQRLNKKYPGLSRAVTAKQGKLTNGKFNQDLSNKAILIEFGGVDNTFEELYRTADALADIFSEYYWQAEKVTSPIEQEAEAQ
ncbi:stage II sporulation protein P [Bacillus sp. CGMCC 1.16607]|uniref:stage II sporulation protein P n=1 Tax=Bacillus sp. CGMCC 1.16607 TaxID=3351842 RepID=UPI0036335D6D